MSHASLSRRTWLWTSTTALAAACARPTPTKLPADGPEPHRELSRRGAENLHALAELGAALRWVHPSDQALETEWEPLLLDGIRALEHARTHTELVEGLRGLMGEVAPTVVIWRADPHTDEQPDDPACPKPAPDEPPPEDPQPDASAPPADQPSAEAKPEHRARPPTEKIETRSPKDARPPVRNEPGVASESGGEPEPEQPEASAEASAEAKPNEAKSSDAKPNDAKPADAKPAETKPTDAKPADAKPADAKPNDAKPADAKPADAKPTEQPEEPEPAEEPEPQPALHEALFAEGPGLVISQWHRQGYFDGLAGQVGCARRIHRAPAFDDAGEVPEPTHGRTRARADACPHCDAQATLTPGAPALLPLTRGLNSLIPIALWTRDGRTLPAKPALEPAPAFDEARAWDYDLADRGTRLLAVLRCYSLMRRFYAQRERVGDAHEQLRASLCAAAEAEDPSSLHAALERLLAVFADGNAELRLEFGKSARRFTPPLSLAWVDERVVVSASAVAGVVPGDVVRAIDGVAIDELLARELPRTCAATPSTAIARTVARLLDRRERDRELELELLRVAEIEEQLVQVRTRASEPTGEQTGRRSRLTEARPRETATELDDGVWYVDPTRRRGLAGVLGRLRRAKVAIVDLRGELADPDTTLAGHWASAPLELAHVRSMSGPDARGELSLTDDEPITLTPRGPQLHARVLVLVDHRTRGAAELEALGFEALGATLVGTPSAGDLGQISHAWLPGGWQLRFTTTELRRTDGRSLWARALAPSRVVAPTRAGLRDGIDEVLTAARQAVIG